MSSPKEKEKASHRMTDKNKNDKEIHEKMTNSYKASENM